MYRSSKTGSVRPVFIMDQIAARIRLAPANRPDGPGFKQTHTNRQSKDWTAIDYEPLVCITCSSSRLSGPGSPLSSSVHLHSNLSVSRLHRRACSERASSRVSSVTGADYMVLCYLILISIMSYSKWAAFNLKQTAAFCTAACLSPLQFLPFAIGDC